MNSLGIKISCFPVLPVAHATQFVSKSAQKNVMVFSMCLSWSETFSKMVLVLHMRQG